MPKRLIVKIPVNTGPSTPIPEPSDDTINGFRVFVSGNKLTLEPVESIPNNMEVVATFKSGLPAADGTSLKTNVDFWYTTKYNPVFSTPTIVRLTEGLGAWISDVPDDTIWRTILKNTLRSGDIWDDGYSKMKIKGGLVPWCVREFVLYSTVLDLLTHLIIYLINISGSKRLADLTVDNRGPQAFQNVLNQFREHVVEKVDDLYYKVRIKCGPLKPLTGVRGDRCWEPRPIIDADITWKRYPHIDRINPIWGRMYPNSQYGKKLQNLGEAYDVGKLIVPKIRKGDFIRI